MVALSGRARRRAATAVIAAVRTPSDPAGIHHRDRHARFGIAQEDQAGDVGQAARLVAGDANPLHAGIGRRVHHSGAGQKQGLLRRLQGQLRLHHGPAFGLGREHGFHCQFNVRQAEAAGFDVGVGEIEDFLAQLHVAALLSMGT